MPTSVEDRFAIHGLFIRSATALDGVVSCFAPGPRWKAPLSG